jgi:hypothetical protein
MGPTANEGRLSPSLVIGITDPVILTQAVF